MTALLNIENLNVTAMVDGEQRKLIKDLSLRVKAGEAVGLVGESGSGKSMTARSVMRLQPGNVRVEGNIEFDGRPVLEMSQRDLRAYRRADVAMIFQDPRAAINPVHTIGAFLTEGLRRNNRLPKDVATRRAVEALEAVGISRAQDRLSQYPHEFSGGMLQRVMICSTLLAGTRLLLADEPTTALDVTTQAEVVGILDALRRDRGLGMLFITHDLDLAAALCDRVCVMYAGQIVESRPARDFAEHAQHPYSRALFGARPSATSRAVRLPAIPGSPVSAFDVGDSCALAPRCPHVRDLCRAGAPELRPFKSGEVRCVRAEELASDLLREGA
jgi:oligopeptide/dipeptide ABC transporter ATP-binding protein